MESNDRIVSGYRIVKEVANGNQVIAFGYNPEAPQQYVTWQRRENQNGYDFGHYFTDKTLAEKDFENRSNADEATNNRKGRLFVDMDGTVARWETKAFEDLFEQGYYLNRPAYQDVIDGIDTFRRYNPNVEVYSLSAYLTESEFALEEKDIWIDRNMPQINYEHRIFVPYGENKADYVPEGICRTDFLLDDYTKNLKEWESKGGAGIKLLNGINNTHGTWTQSGGRTVNSISNAETIGGELTKHIDTVLKQMDMKSEQENTANEQRAKNQVLGHYFGLNIEM